MVENQWIVSPRAAYNCILSKSSDALSTPLWFAKRKNSETQHRKHYRTQQKFTYAEGVTIRAWWTLDDITMTIWSNQKNCLRD